MQAPKKYVDVWSGGSCVISDVHGYFDFLPNASLPTTILRDQVCPTKPHLT